MNRFKELILKLLSIKGFFAIITTVAYFMNKIDYWYVMVAWALFIGSRELYKLLGKKYDKEK